jgi:valyl-tRNA synthetase
MVPRGDRSHEVVEPYLTDQWYVKIKPLAEPAIKAVEDGRIRFVPSNWDRTYYEWMHNIEDWCISRQLWWGHRIPAWYDTDGNIYVARDEQAVRDKYGLADELQLRRDEDVLDTWFSSALWPFSTLGWPNDTERLRRFYPTDVLVTGFDIIFFWVARMIMLGLKFMGEVPFHEVYIHGLVRDSHGQKMSKSKGNILDPLDLIDGIELEPLVQKRTAGLMQPQMAKTIEKATREDFASGIPAFGTDALRFTFAALATTGRDINFDLGRTEGYRNFCNKLWNAARFVLMNTDGHDTGLGEEPTELTLADRWIISRLQSIEAETARNIDAYRLDLAAQVIYEFTWSEYCDWYLELSKTALNDDRVSPQTKRGTRRTLVRVLEALLRLVHPIMPFITEEIWQRVAPLAGKSGGTIMLQPYPQSDPSKIDEAAVAEMKWLQGFVLGVRRIRGEMNIAPSKPLPVLLQNGDESDRERLDGNLHYLRNLARIESVRWLSDDEQAPDSATALLAELRILIPMAGLIDKEAELTRLRKQIDKLEKDLHRARGKLANPEFVDRAPTEIVAKEQARVGELEASLGNLKDQEQQIGRL